MTGSKGDTQPIGRLTAEFVARHRRGETPSRAEYLRRYPHLANEINTHFPTEQQLAALSNAEPPDGLFGALLGNLNKPPDHLGDYRIVRELGRGGMGIVYEAEQVSLGRHVALKVLATPCVADSKHVERFHREAKAAARLHHTNIVPVFGVGEQDGLHYYVMQYIEGKGLDVLFERLRDPMPTQIPSAIASNDPATPDVTMLCPTPLRHEDGNFEITQEGANGSPPLASLEAAPVPEPLKNPFLGATPSGVPTIAAASPPPAAPAKRTREHFHRAARIALQIAEALHYAHGQGILHRDIKPANLLVDASETVWVLDFGLAKLMEQNDLTQPGEVTGTLRYAPPERFQGRSDARSDIYSLGLTLYEMITLRPAFDEADHGSLMRKVMHEEPPPPHLHNPSLPRDLETVLLKAIARDPAHRYQTAEELADDLRRFLEDKPVMARRIGSLERLRRWCRRNPVVASLTATAAMLLLLITVVASMGYAYTSAALNREARQRKEADEQRSRAEANLALSLHAFEQVFESVTKHGIPRPVEEGLEDGDEPPFHPVVSPDVALLLQDLLKFYDQFGEQNSTDPNLQRDAVRAHRRVGDLQQRLGQWDKSEIAYSRALALYGKFIDSFPNEMVFRRETAATWNELGFVYMMTGRLDKAEGAHCRALKILQEPWSAAPGVVYRFELVRTYNDLGYVKWKQGQVIDAGENLAHGLEWLDGLLKEDRKNPSYRLTAAQVNRQLALIHGLNKRPKDENDAINRAIKILEELDREFPAVPDYRYELSETYAMLNLSLRSSQLRQQAEARFRKAVDLATDLTKRFPNVPEYHVSLARSQRKLGTVLRSANNLDAADKAFRQSIKTQQTLVERFPAVPDYLTFLAESQLSLGELLRDRKRLPEARTVLEDSIENQLKFLKSNDRNIYVRRVLANQYRVVADVLRSQNNTTEAHEMEKKSEEMNRELKTEGQ